MLRHLKSLTLPLITAFSLTHPQSTIAMGIDPVERISKQTATPMDVDTTLTSYMMIPDDVSLIILEKAASLMIAGNIERANLVSVCRDWKSIVDAKKIDWFKVDNLCWKAWNGILGHEDIYERFRSGKLIYKPDPNSDTGMIVLNISNLLNPLNGTFDLTKCGDTGKYLSIHTGYRKGIKQENKNKVEIWIVPTFLIKKKLTSTAAHFEAIKDKLTADYCLFWTWGNWDNLTWYDYLTSSSTNDISRCNLYKNWTQSISISSNTRSTIRVRYLHSSITSHAPLTILFQVSIVN